jgi:hypothetical protein
MVLEDLRLADQVGFAFAHCDWHLGASDPDLILSTLSKPRFIPC